MQEICSSFFGPDTIAQTFWAPFIRRMFLTSSQRHTCVEVQVHMPKSEMTNVWEWSHFWQCNSLTDWWPLQGVPHHHPNTAGIDSKHSGDACTSDCVDFIKAFLSKHRCVAAVQWSTKTYGYAYLCVVHIFAVVVLFVSDQRSLVECLTHRRAVYIPVPVCSYGISLHR